QRTRRVLQRGSGRTLDNYKEISLIFFGNKAAGDALIDKVRSRQPGEEDSNHSQLLPREPVQQPLISQGAATNDFIDASEEPVLRAVAMPQQQCRQRRRKCERVEC